MRKTATALWGLVLAATMSACGGGGGDDAPAPAVTFTPAVLQANVQAGSSATLTVRATAADTSIFSSSLYVAIADSQQVLTGAVDLAVVNSTTVSATVRTSPLLAAGRHTGTLQVHLCNDTACKSSVRGSPVPLAYDLTVTPLPLVVEPLESLSASSPLGVVRDPIIVQVRGPNSGWTATSSASWLVLDAARGTGIGAFKVVLPGSLAQGTHTAEVTVRSDDGQTVVLPVTFEVQPIAFTTMAGVHAFTAVNGAPIEAVGVGFGLNNNAAASWTATPSAAWLGVTPLAGTSPGWLNLRPDPSKGPLPSGTHTGTITLSANGLADKQIPVSLTLTRPVLAAPATALTFGGASGRDMTTAQTLRVSLNTGTNNWPFVLTGLPSWLTTTTASGTVGQGGTTLSFKPNAAGVLPASASATVTMTATVNGDTVDYPITVNLNADQRRLLVSEPAVAFSSTPAASTTSRVLKVVDNFGGAIGWTATSDAAWLAITPSGNTGGLSTLTLIPDLVSLPSEVISYANVTVTSDVAGVPASTVRVAVWKSASNLGAVLRVPATYAHIAADRLRPHVYVNNGGNSIDVYHVHTGQKVGTATGVGAALGAMAVSPDGTKVYVLDTASRTVVTVDPATLAPVASWPLEKAVSRSTNMLVIRPNGEDVLLLSDQTAYVDGRSVGATPFSGLMAASADGRKVFAGQRYDVDYSRLSGGMLIVTAKGGLDLHSGGNLQDVASNADGSRVYQASGGGVASGGYKCGITDGASGSYIGALPGGEAYPNNVEVTRDGRVICAIAGYYTTYDIFVHGANGALLQSHKVAGYAKTNLDDSLVAAADGFVLVTLTDDPALVFVPIGAGPL